MNIDATTTPIAYISPNHASDYFMREGVYGAKVIHNNEPIYLRMERITKENTESWNQYRKMSTWVANCHSRDVLSVFLQMVEDDNVPEYNERLIQVFGFSRDEYQLFTEKAKALKEKNALDKVRNIIRANSVGMDHMTTAFDPEKENYIVYATTNPDFNILGKPEVLTVKNFIDSYNDILISVGADFSKGRASSIQNNSFHNRGISRNPWWVFEEKYAGLSMLLHGFIGAVAEKYFLEKEYMTVRPIGSMQSIISKNLEKGDGFLHRSTGERVDLSQLVVSPKDAEGNTNYIKVSALSRIFNKALVSQS